MNQRTLWTKIKEYLDKDTTIVITGARRVGKTTTLKWLLSEISSTNKRYFDLENVATRDLFDVRDYRNIIHEFTREGLDSNKRMTIAIDEIQYVKNLPSIVKYLQDNYDIRFILSGSSSYYLKNLFSESLAGRKVIFELYPLTFSEFLLFKNESYTIDGSIRKPIRFDTIMYQRLWPLYEEYINYGGLPQVVLASTLEEKQQFLEDAYSSYINLDVQTLSDFKSLKEFRKLVKLLATRVGSKVNSSNLASVLGISRQTVESYIEFMYKTYLIQPIHVYSKSEDIKARKQEKIYFVDNGILNINSDLSSGSKFENAVYMQLAYSKDIRYYEARTKEIDFIIDGHTAIEVKETPNIDDIQNTLQRSNEIGIDKAFVVGKNENKSLDAYLWGGTLG